LGAMICGGPKGPGLKAISSTLDFVGLKPPRFHRGGLPSALSHIPNAGPFDKLRAGCGTPGFVRVSRSLELQVLRLRRFAAPLRMTNLLRSDDLRQTEEPGPKGHFVNFGFRGAEAPRFHRGRTAVRPVPHPKRGTLRLAQGRLWGTRSVDPPTLPQRARKDGAPSVVVTRRACHPPVIERSSFGPFRHAVC
jgi:hypothetical protein